MDPMDLKELAESIDDVEEPAWMDVILICKNQLDEEDEDYMELLVKTVTYEEIYWHQPWYQVSSSLTRPLKDEGNHLERYETGPMNKMERDLIKENWNKFIKQFDVPDKPLCLVRWKSKKRCRKPDTPEERVRRYITAFLAQGLKRTLYQVFKYINSNLGDPAKGPFSVYEKKIMKVCFTHEPNNAVTILSKVLRREPRALYTRLHHKCQGKPFRKKIKWSLDLAEKYLKLLMKHTGLPLQEIKNKKIEKAVWLKLEDEFEQHYYHLASFWRQSLHAQVFVKKTWKLRRLRYKILDTLKQFSSYQVWSDIRWKEVAKKFPDGFTPRFIYKLCYEMMDINDLKSKSLDEVIEIALEKLKYDGSCRKKRMRTLAFNKCGKLEEINYNKLENVLD